MMLSQLSVQYRESAQLCRDRAHELEPRLGDKSMCEVDRLRLRRRILTLMTMARDAMAISRYLENYYGDDENE